MCLYINRRRVLRVFLRWIVCPEVRVAAFQAGTVNIIEYQIVTCWRLGVGFGLVIGFIEHL
jgi:hypothetical protein